MAKFSDVRVGYGQVEPNQLSAQKTGQIYASLPLAADVAVLQNGEFMYYNEATGKVQNTGFGEPYLVFNEIKLYEDAYRTTYKDFAMIRVAGTENYVTSKLATASFGDGATTTSATINPAHTEYGYRMDGMAPRLFKTNVGDIMTTNMVEAADVDAVAAGDIFVPQANTTTKTLVLTKTGTTLPTSGMAWVCAKKYTMPDGQPAVKLQRVQ